MSRQNIHDANAYNLKLWNGKQGTIRLTLTSGYEIRAEGPTAYFLDGGASDRIITLPAFSGGLHYFIGNVGTTNLLTVQTQGASLVVTLDPGEAAWVASSDIEWIGFSSFLNSYAPADSDYLVKTANGSLTAERVVGDSSAIAADWSVAGAVTFGLVDGGVTNAKLANMATQRVKGRNTAGTGVPEDITTPQLLEWLSSSPGALAMRGASAWQALAPGTNGQILLGQTGAIAAWGTMAGDATISAAGSVTIANDAVSNAKLANMATQTLKGRNTAGTGDPEDLNATQVTAMLNVAVGDSGSGGTKGLVPAPAAGDAAASKVLTAGMVWAAPASGEIARASNILTPYENLVITYNSANIVDITADGLLLFNSSGVAKRFSGLSTSVNLAAANGAGGIDSGAEAANTWYALWGIGQAGGTFAAMASTSTTAPTLPGTYTFKGLIGFVRNDASSNLIVAKQRGNKVTQKSSGDALSIGTATTVTTVDLSAHVPTLAIEALVRANLYTSSGTASGVAVLGPAGTAASTTMTYGEYAIRGVGIDTAGVSDMANVFLSTPQQMAYYIALLNGRLDLKVMGYTL